MPFLRDAVEDGKVELVLGGVEIDEQIVDFVQHLLRPRVTAVDLVDHHDGRQLGLQRFAQDIASLRQGALARVHQQQHAVHQLQGALHLAAEVAVAGRIHDVDARAVIGDGGVLGQDGDAALALEFVRVHHALHHGLPLAENPALPEHGVHQRGLAVVHVRDDGDVANRCVQTKSSLDQGPKSMMKAPASGTR